MELERLAQTRLDDAKVLLDGGRYDGAKYLCGYALELKLKARICRTLNWVGYPATKNEFQNLLSFRTHNLDVLLQLSDQEQPIRERYLPLWNRLSVWNPERRYDVIGSVAATDVFVFINDVASFLDLI